jgi:hypothetical protein
MTTKNDQDDVLLTKLNVAVRAANEAEASVTTAQAELVSRSKAVGLLLLEAKKLHPKVKDFEAYLKRVDGLKLSRTYDFMRLAGGRTTDEELRKDARERKRRSRAKPKTLPKPEPKSEPEKVSVTVTESPATGSNIHDCTAEDARALTAVLREQRLAAAAESGRNLLKFEYACRTYLPRLNEADLEKAHACFMEACPKSKKEAA